MLIKHSNKTQSKNSSVSINVYMITTITVYESTATGIYQVLLTIQ